MQCNKSRFGRFAQADRLEHKLPSCVDDDYLNLGSMANSAVDVWTKPQSCRPSFGRIVAVCESRRHGVLTKAEAACSACSKSLRLMGFVRRQRTRSSDNSSSVSSCPEMTINSWRGWLWRMTSNPLMPGIEMSVIATSGHRVWQCSRSSYPSSATATCPSLVAVAHVRLLRLSFRGWTMVMSRWSPPQSGDHNLDDAG